MNSLKKTESGFAQLVVLGVMALMAVALPLTTNLVKKNQENRSKAAEEDGVKIFYQFGASDDYRILDVGMDVETSLKLTSYSQKIGSATIVYCYTDVLKPYMVSGDQIHTMVSNKTLGNNCDELVVDFNNSNDGSNNSTYLIKVMAKIIKRTNRSVLMVDKTKSSIIGVDGKPMAIGSVDGTTFSIYGSSNTGSSETSTTTENNSEQKYVEGKHINLNLNKEHTGVITDDNLKLWLSKLDSEYETLTELTGRAPFDGRKITIKEYKCDENGYGNEKYACMYWAWAGEVTGWAGGQVESELKKINDNGDWSFGILHEISHSFDTDGWNFDGELMANFKMAYFLEKSGGKVWQNNRFYTGKEIKDFYKISNTYGYDDVLKSGNYASDFIAYKLLDIKDKIGGWDIYKQVFRNLSTKSYTSESKRLTAFLIELANVSKVDVINLFTSEEKKVIENKFGTVFTPKCGFAGGVYTETPNENSMCEVGVPKLSGGINRTTMVYRWTCTVGSVVRNCSASPVNGGLGILKISSIPVSRDVVNGKCGESRNTCASGMANDNALPDTTNDYKWKCMGNNGGKNVDCSLSKKISGKCGSKRNTCVSGSVSVMAEMSTLYRWRCVGKYGGETVSCSVRK